VQSRGDEEKAYLRDFEALLREHAPNRGEVHVARQDRHAHLLLLREGLQPLDQRVAFLLVRVRAP
jgi:hypothetical protein